MFLSNTLEEYLIVLGIFVVLFVVLRFVQKFVIKKLQKLSLKTKTDLDDTFIEIVKSIRPGFYTFLAFYLALLSVSLPSGFRKWLGILLLVWIVVQAIKAVQILIDYFVQKKFSNENPDAESAFKFLASILKWTLWLVGLILILSNLGINVSSLIAGLGIGGIAIAMAVKGVLEDLFSAFAIHFDKPFVVGDQIKVGEDIGKVEKIGIKSTRIRSSQNEELIISNKELTSVRVQNFKRMEERKVKLIFGVTYETGNEKMKSIPKIVENIINGVEKARFDRAHFTTFSASSLDFDVVYFVESDNFTDYMNAQQEINFAIKEKFEKKGIEMAYPTQTIYLAK